jgi:hypothetical protein
MAETATYLLISTYSDGRPVVTGTTKYHDVTPDGLVECMLADWYNDGKGGELFLDGLRTFLRNHWSAFSDYYDEHADDGCDDAFKERVMGMPLEYANDDCDPSILKHLYGWLRDFCVGHFDEFLNTLAGESFDPLIVIKNPDPRLDRLLALL